MILSRGTLILGGIQVAFLLCVMIFFSFFTSPMDSAQPPCVIVYTYPDHSSNTTFPAIVQSQGAPKEGDDVVQPSRNVPLSPLQPVERYSITSTAAAAITSSTTSTTSTPTSTITTASASVSSTTSVTSPVAPPTKPPLSSGPARLLFSINSGRVGSGYLYKILQGAGVAKVFHEGAPVMNGNFLKNASMMGLEATREARMFKIKTIDKHLNSTHAVPEMRMYAESSHLFFKTFQDIVMEQYLGRHHITVVMLSRYLPLVLSSHDASKVWMSNCSDMKKAGFPDWYYNVATSKLAVTYPQPLPACTPDGMEMAMGYLIDVEVHKQRFKRLYGNHPNVTIVEVRLEQLNTEESVFEFLRQIGIPREVIPPLNQRWLLDRVVGRGYNTRAKFLPRQSVPTRERPTPPPPPGATTAGRPIQTSSVRPGLNVPIPPRPPGSPSSPTTTVHPVLAPPQYPTTSATGNPLSPAPVPVPIPVPSTPTPVSTLTPAPATAPALAPPTRGPDPSTPAPVSPSTPNPSQPPSQPSDHIRTKRALGDAEDLTALALQFESSSEHSNSTAPNNSTSSSLNEENRGIPPASNSTLTPVSNSTPATDRESPESAPAPAPDPDLTVLEVPLPPTPAPTPKPIPTPGSRATSLPKQTPPTPSGPLKTSDKQLIPMKSEVIEIDIEKYRVMLENFLKRYPPNLVIPSMVPFEEIAPDGYTPDYRLEPSRPGPSRPTEYRPPPGSGPARPAAGQTPPQTTSSRTNYKTPYVPPPRPPHS